jgi:hypothetical protein
MILAKTPEKPADVQATTTYALFADTIQKVSMTDHDRRLMVEIKAQAKIAYQSRPKTTNASELAAALHKDFPHRTVEEIQQKNRKRVASQRNACFGEQSI